MMVQNGRKFLVNTAAALVLSAGLFVAAAPAMAFEPAQTDRAVNHYSLDKNKLAISGYDPVAYFPEGGGTPTKGKKEFSHTFQGATYHFANQKNLDAFKADPLKYEPAHGGWCSYAVAEKNEKVEVDPKSFRIEDGRLLLFYKGIFGDTKKDWEKQPGKLLPKADANWKKTTGEDPHGGEKKTSSAADLFAPQGRVIGSALSAEQGQQRRDPAADVPAQAIKVGDVAPDFELADTDGTTVKLSNLLTKGPVVLTFYRGQWCPFCNRQLQGYQASLSEITGAGGQLVAVSPQLVENSAETKKKINITFPLLSDVGNKVAKQYRLAYSVNFDALRRFNGPEGAGELPVTATYVVSTDGKVTYAYVDSQYQKRAEVSDIVAALNQLKAKQ